MANTKEELEEMFRKELGMTKVSITLMGEVVLYENSEKKAIAKVKKAIEKWDMKGKELHITIVDRYHNIIQADLIGEYNNRVNVLLDLNNAKQKMQRGA